MLVDFLIMTSSKSHPYNQYQQSIGYSQHQQYQYQHNYKPRYKISKEVNHKSTYIKKIFNFLNKHRGLYIILLQLSASSEAVFLAKISATNQWPVSGSERSIMPIKSKWPMTGLNIDRSLTSDQVSLKCSTQ